MKASNSSASKANEYLKSELDDACYRLGDALRVLADTAKLPNRSFIAPKGNTLYIVKRAAK